MQRDPSGIPEMKGTDMSRSSAFIVAAGLAFALVAGTASRALTLRSTTAGAPVRVVVLAPAQPAPAPSFVESDWYVMTEKRRRLSRRTVRAIAWDAGALTLAIPWAAFRLVPAPRAGAQAPSQQVLVVPPGSRVVVQTGAAGGAPRRDGGALEGSDVRSGNHDGRIGPVVR